MQNAVCLSLALVLAAAVAPACGGAQASHPVEAEIAKTGSGKVTVLEFVDYQCPFCRQLDAELGPLLEEHAEHVRVVRKHVPLPRHRHARAAARASVCAEAQGKGHAMHTELMRASDLSQEGLNAIAEQVGLDLTAMAECIADSATDARIRADDAEYDATGGSGLPTIFIGRRKIVGFIDGASLERALTDALDEVR
jgi:protein-disulfide isomerase